MHKTKSPFKGLFFYSPKAKSNTGKRNIVLINRKIVRGSSLKKVLSNQFVLCIGC
jgi:hypothetical protein